METQPRIYDDPIMAALERESATFKLPMMQSAGGSILQKLGFTQTRTPSAVYYETAAAPPIHKKMRLTPNPGAPKLRAAGSSYKNVGFHRPVLASVHGAGALPLRILQASAPVPENFCWLPQDLTSTMDQGQCGSCWAHATASILGDRVSVLTNGAVRTALEVQQIMECSDYVAGCPPVGCQGNEIYIALASLASKGTKLNAVGQYDRKYAATDSSQSMCATSPDSKYNVTVAEAFLISEAIAEPGNEANKRNIQNMKNHIYFEGPIIGTFLVYSDFQNYDGTTIYEPSAAVLSGSPEGAHAIELIGWGKDPASGAEYWVGRNSWGTAWPQNHRACSGTGTFFFLMGKNTCQIEAWCAGARPTIHNGEMAPKDAGGLYPGSTPCDDSNWHQLKDLSSVKVGQILGAIVGITVIVGIGVAIYLYDRKRKHATH